MAGFSLVLSVCSLDFKRPLTGKVILSLHDTFDKDVIVVAARGGRARLPIGQSALSVGAKVESRHGLELELANVPNVPRSASTPRRPKKSEYE